MKEDKPLAKGQVKDTTDAAVERVGTHAAATTGGALAGAAAGAASGLAFGPVGSVAGAVGGALAGAAAGASTGRGVDIDTEAFERHWREQYASRPYATAGRSYEHYAPAYRYAIQSYARSDHPRTWDEVQEELRAGWNDARGESPLAWDEAEPAMREAWEHMYDPAQSA
ncbi:hypothetical protein [Ideonella sp. BN130291]|uniref:hypothetical protein n=1 Tax=Ideonella sp. BN130291 TaxID=3112940 RepID=UPI002E262F62|nr:hypothetical protein [Ideonella sp. BN130291]